ncbi:hypothetical protein EYZ11_009828 [Aspergillus tanneri]|uniref:Uncharacterized protein n=1 Tax=Aspergillus tanneri TaxID=1220188 RepID=A0A4S3J924_9EURO|nr:hypothetical protein EYZ11_009828 [Aspergillus tanneri]
MAETTTKHSREIPACRATEHGVAGQVRALTDLNRHLSDRQHASSQE